MKIKKDSEVTLSYELKYDGPDGETIELIDDKDPLKVKFGIEELLESFEGKLIGMAAGETFEFVLTSDEAYGDYVEEGVIELPKDSFITDDDEDDILFEGNEVPMKDEEGNEYIGIILEISDDTVTVDLNHPLAGEDLYFKGKVLKVE